MPGPKENRRCARRFRSAIAASALPPAGSAGTGRCWGARRTGRNITRNPWESCATPVELAGPVAESRGPLARRRQGRLFGGGKIDAGGPGREDAEGRRSPSGARGGMAGGVAGAGETGRAHQRPRGPRPSPLGRAGAQRRRAGRVVEGAAGARCAVGGPRGVGRLGEVARAGTAANGFRAVAGLHRPNCLPSEAGNGIPVIAWRKTGSNSRRGRPPNSASNSAGSSSICRPVAARSRPQTKAP